jgi:hypothetical protein
MQQLRLRRISGSFSRFDHDGTPSSAADGGLAVASKVPRWRWVRSRRGLAVRFPGGSDKTCLNRLSTVSSAQWEPSDVPKLGRRFSMPLSLNKSEHCQPVLKCSGQVSTPT